MSKSVEEMTAHEVLVAMYEIHNLGSFAYVVRAVAEQGLSGHWDGDSWDHPVVKRWSALCVRAKELIEGQQ